MKIDCISDLHGFYPELEGGDLLIVAGDLTASDHPYEYNKFARWIRSFEYKKRIVISGNHDNWIIDSNNLGIQEAAEIGEFEYLCDSGTEFEGLKIWGSPWTKTFEGMNPHCKAFTVDSEDDLEKKWKNMPYDVDILITHSPPFGVLDQVVKGDRFIEGHQCDKFENVGSLHLYLLLKYALRPRLHVFGHIHEGYGQEQRFTNCISVNASHVNERYQSVNKLIRIEL